MSVYPPYAFPLFLSCLLVGLSLNAPVLAQAQAMVSVASAPSDPHPAGAKRVLPKVVTGTVLPAATGGVADSTAGKGGAEAALLPSIDTQTGALKLDFPLGEVHKFIHKYLEKFPMR